MFVSSGNKHFFTKSCHRQIYEQPPQTSHFSVSKIGQIFPKKIFHYLDVWFHAQLAQKILNGLK